MTTDNSNNLLDININEPRFDQNTYVGRAKHFLLVTNPLNVLASASSLENARAVISKHK